MWIQAKHYFTPSMKNSLKVRNPNANEELTLGNFVLSRFIAVELLLQHEENKQQQQQPPPQQSAKNNNVDDYSRVRSVACLFRVLSLTKKKKID